MLAESDVLPEFLEKIKALARPGELGLAVINMGATKNKSSNAQSYESYFNTTLVLGRLNPLSNLEPKMVDHERISFTKSIFELGGFALNPDHRTDWTIDKAAEAAIVEYVPAKALRTETSCHSPTELLSIVVVKDEEEIHNHMIDVNSRFVGRVFIRNGIKEPHTQLIIGGKTLPVRMEATLYVSQRPILDYVSNRNPEEIVPLFKALEIPIPEAINKKFEASARTKALAT